MARVHGVSFHIVAPGFPEREGSTGLRIPSIEWPMSAPECQERAGDASRLQAISIVMFAIERRGGSIFLTDRMGMHGISEHLRIDGAHLRRKYGPGGTPFSECMIDDRVGCRCQDAFRKRLGLSKQRPGPVAQRKLRVGAVPDGGRRQDVENGEAVEDMGRLPGVPRVTVPGSAPAVRPAASAKSPAIAAQSIPAWY